VVDGRPRGAAGEAAAPAAAHQLTTSPNDRLLQASQPALQRLTDQLAGRSDMSV